MLSDLTDSIVVEGVCYGIVAVALAILLWKSSAMIEECPELVAVRETLAWICAVIALCLWVGWYLGITEKVRHRDIWDSVRHMPKALLSPAFAYLAFRNAKSWLLYAVAGGVFGVTALNALAVAAGLVL
jgi:hypothetical protein